MNLCFSEGWDNDLEEDAPEGEDTNEDGCWTEEDDETPQVEYFGSDSCSMSSPSGLRDAFSEWTVVTRKSRIWQQCFRRRGCLDERGAVLGTLWDDDSDVILGQVADDRTKKEMVKTFAIVDSGAEANALSREHEAVDFTEAEFVRKDFPRRKKRNPIPATTERSLTGRTDEGQCRRIVWEVCPTMRPLFGVAKITKEVKSTWARTRPSSRTTRRGKSQTSVESATCGCLTCG